MHDVVVVGGGPAGLSAALLLGRALRRVVVVDAGAPRGAAVAASHGLFTRDGADPAELRALGRAQLAPYAVDLVDGAVAEARRVPGGLAVRLADGRAFDGRRLLLATGVVDALPAVPGAGAYYGRGIYPCPYCDAWEHRGQSLAAYGSGLDAAHGALALRNWSDRVALFRDGAAGALPADLRTRLTRAGVRVWPGKVLEFFGDGAGLAATRVADAGGPVAVATAAVFLHTPTVQASVLPFQLGCRMDPGGGVAAGPDGQTSVPGVYVAGDATREMQWVVVAAAGGARTGAAIDAALRLADFG